MEHEIHQNQGSGKEALGQKAWETPSLETYSVEKEVKGTPTVALDAAVLGS